MVITLDNKDVKRYARQLRVFADKAYPFATKSALNEGAFDAQRRYRGNAREKLTLRNTYTRTSIQVDQARGLNVEAQRAVVGSTAGYMATQEFGGTEEGQGMAQPIATNTSAGQSYGVRPRTKLPTRRNKRKNINLTRDDRRGTSRKQRNVAAAMGAAKSGRVVYMDLGRVKGLFRVKGTRAALDVRLIWSLSQKSVKIPATPLLAPAIVETRQRMPQFYLNALRFQVKRHNLFT